MQKLDPQGDFIVHGRTPLNAEPRSPLLVERFLTPQSAFYIRNHGGVPALGLDHWVELTGLVDRPATSCLADLRRDFAERTVTAVLQCAGNRRADLQSVEKTSGDPWLMGAIGNAEWTGVALSDVLTRAGVDESRARFVAFTCADEVDVDGEVAPYGVSITIERALAGDVLIALALSGEPLAPEHGSPMRIIVPDQAGVRSAKWIERIEVRDTPSDAPIQARDYKLFPASVAKDEADWDMGLTIEAMPVTSAICVPEQGASVPAGRTRLEGYAVAYGRSVARVDVSTDGGNTWRQAALRSDPGARAAWTLWSIEVDLPRGAFCRFEQICAGVDPCKAGCPLRIVERLVEAPADPEFEYASLRKRHQFGTGPHDLWVRARASDQAGEDGFLLERFPAHRPSTFLWRRAPIRGTGPVVRHRKFRVSGSSKAKRPGPLT